MGAAVFLFLVAIAGAPWYGYVLSVLWAWFVVPTFHAPLIGVVTAMGISLLVHFVTYRSNAATTEDDGTTTDKVVRGVFNSLVLPALVLALGYVLHLFA